MSESKLPHKTVLDYIGNTPIIKLNRMTKDMQGEFFAKVESFNPGHSSKDRIALYILEQAEQQGIETRRHHR